MSVVIIVHYMTCVCRLNDLHVFILVINFSVDYSKSLAPTYPKIGSSMRLYDFFLLLYRRKKFVWIKLFQTFTNARVCRDIIGIIENHLIKEFSLLFL